MSKFQVYMQTAISISTEEPDAESAARYVRDRILGVLREMPSEFVGIGFEPQFSWHVREVSGSARPGPIVMAGIDDDLRQARQPADEGSRPS